MRCPAVSANAVAVEVVLLTVLTACGTTETVIVELPPPTEAIIPTHTVAPEPTSTSAMPAFALMAPTPTAVATGTRPLSSPTSEIVELSGPVIANIPADLPPYDRDEWQHWVDPDGDCQNTRHEVLIDESSVEVTFKTDEQCHVQSGQRLGLFAGVIVGETGALDIDYMVPLKTAHVSGGWARSPEKKKAYANDLNDADHLIAVTSSANRSTGAKGPDEWKPPDGTYWCEYARDWIRIKNAWELTLTPAEWDALVEMLRTCPPEVTAGIEWLVEFNLRPFPTAPTETTSEIVILEMTCFTQPEWVSIVNDGITPQDMTGWRLHDEGGNWTFEFHRGFVLQVRSAVRVWSFGQAPEGPDSLHWTNSAVWNNTGDTAYLYDLAGGLVSHRPC